MDSSNSWCIVLITEQLSYLRRLSVYKYRIKKQFDLILSDRWLFDKTGLLLHCSAQSRQSKVIRSFSEGKLAGKIFSFNPMVAHNIRGLLFEGSFRNLDEKLIDFTKK